MATCEQIRDQARENLKIDPGKTVWTDVQLLRWLNEGAAMMHMEQDWKDIERAAQIALVNGTSTYAPAANYKSLITNSIKFTDSNGGIRDVKYVELFELQGSYNDITATGDAPEYIYETAETLGFYPVPNATAATGTLDYRYFDWPDTYVIANTPVFPPQWHFLLEHYIEYRAWGILPGRENSASLALQKWERGLGQMKGERLRRMGPDFQWRSLAKEQKNRI